MANELSTGEPTTAKVPRDPPAPAAGEKKDAATTAAKGKPAEATKPPITAKDVVATKTGYEDTKTKYLRIKKDIDQARGDMSGVKGRAEDLHHVDWPAFKATQRLARMDPLRRQEYWRNLLAYAGYENLFGQTDMLDKTAGSA